MIHLTSAFASASDTCGFAGIGMAPKEPEPPLMTLAASLSSMPFWPAYFDATSLNEGPTSFVCTAWQAMQFLALAMSALANALPETRTDAAASTIITCFIAYLLRNPLRTLYLVTTSRNGVVSPQLHHFVI